MKILAERTVEVKGYPLIIIILIVIAAAIVIAAYIINTFSYNPKICNTCFITSVCVCIMVIALMLFGRTPQEQYQEYKVTFNEKIDMNEFAKKYEMLYQEGDIFIIKDKEHFTIVEK